MSFLKVHLYFLLRPVLWWGVCQISQGLWCGVFG